jgi:hypothetical protein
MSYLHTFQNTPLFFVRYRGTNNGAYIRAATHTDAKWLYARGEGLSSINYFQSKKIEG